MPKLTLPIALMVLGTIKLPGEHDLTDAEAEHALEQLERLGHNTKLELNTQATPSTPSDDLVRVSPEDVLEILAGYLERGELSLERVAERLGFALGLVVEEPSEPETVHNEPAPSQQETPPAPTPPATSSSPSSAAPVIPPAVVRELKKVGFELTKPETIQAADDEALLAVKGMTPELLAQLRQIAG